jgi:hypothetical protein
MAGWLLNQQKKIEQTASFDRGNWSTDQIRYQTHKVAYFDRGA